ncbi:unnamed protein product [Lampetra planeri]
MATLINIAVPGGVVSRRPLNPGPSVPLGSQTPNQNRSDARPGEKPGASPPLLTTLNPAACSAVTAPPTSQTPPARRRPP